MSDLDSKLKSSVEELEFKVAFLEDSLSKLSDEHYQQKRELDALKNQLALISDKLKGGFDKDDSHQPIEDERPPHY
ncbi:MAG: putative coiled-coil protein SlyX [Arenicella sp.]|jgi:uncharacterized coiled-coil protein SlyX